MMKNKDSNADGVDESAEIIHPRSRKNHASSSSQPDIHDESQQLESAYQDLQRTKFISGVEKNEKMIENFQKILLQRLNSSIGGYFYKRKSFYFDNKDQISQKFTIFSKKYEKRYFELNMVAATFSYAKDENKIHQSPDFTVHLRDILSVKRSIVSMPVNGANG